MVAQSTVTGVPLLIFLFLLLPLLDLCVLFKLIWSAYLGSAKKVKRRKEMVSSRLDQEHVFTTRTVGTDFDFFLYFFNTISTLLTFWFTSSFSASAFFFFFSHLEGISKSLAYNLRNFVGSIKLFSLYSSFSFFFFLIKAISTVILIMIKLSIFLLIVIKCCSSLKSSK